MARVMKLLDQAAKKNVSAIKTEETYFGVRQSILGVCQKAEPRDKAAVHHTTRRGNKKERD
eukprot:1156215-Pelagomonas_calceolata.AAC.11